MVNASLNKGIKYLCCAGGYAVIFLLLVACSGVAAEPPVKQQITTDTQPAKTIVWGKVDSEPTDAISTWQPLVDYLAANLGDQGEWSGEVKIAPDTETMSRWTAAGEVDLVIDSLYPAMIVAESSGAVPLALRITGKPDKQAVFFARADSGLTSVQDLKGSVIGMEERHSTSGFMLPVAYLKQAGMEPAEVPGIDAPAGANEVGYTFAGDDDVVALWVINGNTIAGAVDTKTFTEFAEGNPGVLVSLAETESISSDSVLLGRKDLDPAIQQEIKEVLLSMDTTDQGRDILEHIRAENFSDVSSDVGGAWDQTLAMYQLIVN